MEHWKCGVASAFGAAGSLIVVFVWVYYSAQIFLIGAEFTWVYAKTFGSMRHLAEDEVPKSAAQTPAMHASTGRANGTPERAADDMGSSPPAVVAPAAAMAPATGAWVPGLVTVGVAGLVAGLLAQMVLRRRSQAR